MAATLTLAADRPPNALEPESRPGHQTGRFRSKAGLPSRYRHNPAYRLAGFHQDASERLARQVTNQLWRNTLLAAATQTLAATSSAMRS